MSLTISVLMPAYNAAPYLEDAIRSVLAQRGVAFELLLGDDGSTDGTWGIVQPFQGDPRVRAWRWRHRGAAATRNRLASRARGRYVAICDADDILLPGHLTTLAGALDRHAQVGVAYGDLMLVDERTGHQQVRRAPSPGARWDLLGYWGSVWDPGTMVRRSLLRRIGGYRTDLPFMVDVDLFLRLAELTRFCYVPGRPRYVYRQRRGSMSDRPRADYARVATQIRRDAIRRRYGYRVSW